MHNGALSRMLYNGNQINKLNNVSNNLDIEKYFHKYKNLSHKIELVPALPAM